MAYNHSVMDTKTRTFFEFAQQEYSSRYEIVHFHSSFRFEHYHRITTVIQRQCHSSKVLPNDIANNFQLFLSQGE